MIGFMQREWAVPFMVSFGIIGVGLALTIAFSWPEGVASLFALLATAIAVPMHVFMSEAKIARMGGRDSDDSPKSV